MEILDYTLFLKYFDVFLSMQYKKTHLVCPAIDLLVFVNATRGTMGGLADGEPWEIPEKIRKANETGSLIPLYPETCMTILPLTKYEGRDDFGNREIMSRHLKDCLQANELYNKSDDILFAFEDTDDFDIRLAIEILHELAETSSLVFTKRILYLS